MELKKISLEKMESTVGGNPLCYIGIGMLFTPMWFAGALIATAGCLTGDSSGG